MRRRQAGDLVRRLATALVVLALAACAGDEAAGPTSTTAPRQTTTTEVAPAGDGWPRPCRPSTGSAAPSRGSATFGPLGPAPGVVVHLPLADLPPGVEQHEVDRYPWVQPARVDGGLALGIGSLHSSAPETSVVAVVNDDGTTRWVRCLTGQIERIWADEGAGTVLVGGDDWHRFAVDDGEAHPLPELDGYDPMVWEQDRPTRRVLLGKGEPGFTLEDLLLYDLATDRLEHVEVPDEARRQPGCGPVLDVAADGSPVVYGPAREGVAAVAAVWRDGWSRQVDDIDDAVPLRAVGTCDHPLTLRGATGSGAVRWERPDLEHPGLEGAWLVQDGATAVMQTCGTRVDDQCQHELVAVDVATGETRWRRAGYQALAMAADGYLLASEPQGSEEVAWVLRDLRTGTAVPGQRWAARDTFLSGCCGEGEYLHVHRFGGVVVVVVGDEVRVWFGAGDAGGTQEVSVP